MDYSSGGFSILQDRSLIDRAELGPEPWFQSLFAAGMRE